MDLATVATVTTVVVSTLSLLVALIAIWVQTRQNNRALGVTILRELEKDFLWSEEMRSKRLLLAKFLLNRKADDTPTQEVGYILDFFDSMGLYHNKGVIGTEMAWVMFYYWLGHYWQLLKKDAEKSEEAEGGILYFKNARQFYKKLNDFGRRHRNVPPEESYFSPDNLQAFLEGEVRRCSPEEQRPPN